ncbi:MAG: ATP-binding protein [Phormidesmis sp.]
MAGIVTQSSILQTLNTVEAQRVIDLLQQEVTQLRFENQTLWEDRNQERERPQTELSSQLAAQRIKRQQTQSDFTETYRKLEISHNTLMGTIEALSSTLQETRSAKRASQLVNTRLESQVERRSADLYQAERRWRSLLEDVHLVVIGLDCEGKVNYANPFFLRLTGYSQDEVMGKAWFETFILPEDYYHTHHYFQQLITHGEVSLRYRNAILTSSGAARMIDWNNAVLRDRQNRIIGTMSIGEDITERLEIDRIKGEFISVISHELRTPLTAIHGSLELLTGDLVSSESDQGKQLLQLAADSARRLVRLVNDILDLERLESGKVLLNKERVNTRSLTTQVVDVFQVAATERGMTLSVSDPGITMMADGDCLTQVLTNLLDNAIKFSEDSSTIWLSVEQADEDSNDAAAMALFKVRDQGRGIPSEHLAEIFGSFTQVNRTDSREKGGTGLGLAICRNIVEQHEGSIWAESKLGAGSCFQFTIPLNQGVSTAR